jgi:sugar lactone lactonase YvrE
MRTIIRMILYCLFCAPLSFHCIAQSGIITTYVGPGSLKNGVPATVQSFDHPNSVAPDGIGGLYFSCGMQNRIYHMAADGQIRLVAGAGIAGYSGDGGKATSAQLSYPKGLALDSAGNLYFADRENNRIRKVTPDGVITTVAGNGEQGWGGDGGPATSAQLSSPSGVALDSTGNLYIADLAGGCIRKVSFSSR